MKKYLLLLLALTIPAATSVAQTPGPASPDRDGGWLSLGIGRGFPHDISVVASANIGRENVWQVGFSGVSDISLGGEVPSVAAVNVARGFSLVSRWSRVSLSGGPAAVWGKQRSSFRSHDLSRFTTVGLVGSAEFVFTPIKEVGIGFDVYGNVNPAKPVAGIRLLLVVEGNK